MKRLLFPLAAFSLAFGAACLHSSGDNKAISDKAVTDKAVSDKVDIATCYGNTPCNACTSCNYCKWCKAGGTCGICAPQKKANSNTYKTPLKATGRCQAITKKGTQCSRSSRSGGYCWQHGG